MRGLALYAPSVPKGKVQVDSFMGRCAVAGFTLRRRTDSATCGGRVTVSICQ